MLLSTQAEAVAAGQELVVDVVEIVVAELLVVLEILDVMLDEEAESAGQALVVTHLLPVLHAPVLSNTQLV